MNPFSNIKTDLKTYLSISFGIFLFVLFFEPFSLQRFDFNNRLIFVSGLAAIVFLFMATVRGSFRLIIRSDEDENVEFALHPFLSGLIIMVLSSVAYAFYLRYVGLVEITFYTMFKVIIICLAPPVILWLSDTFEEISKHNESLMKGKEELQHYKDDHLNKIIEFVSENITENISLSVADVAFIKSADNYVEIAYKEDNDFHKKLLRNTLKSIEQQLRPYSHFIRCHRTCIVNTHFIQKLNTNYSSHWLTLKGYDEQIPVSRQYLLKLKEAL